MKSFIAIGSAVAGVVLGSIGMWQIKDAELSSERRRIHNQYEAEEEALEEHHEALEVREASTFGELKVTIDARALSKFDWTHPDTAIYFGDYEIRLNSVHEFTLRDSLQTIRPYPGLFDAARKAIELDYFDAGLYDLGPVVPWMFAHNSGDWGDVVRATKDWPMDYWSYKAPGRLIVRSGRFDILHPDNTLDRCTYIEFSDNPYRSHFLFVRAYNRGVPTFLTSGYSQENSYRSHDGTTNVNSSGGVSFSGAGDFFGRIERVSDDGLGLSSSRFAVEFAWTHTRNKSFEDAMLESGAERTWLEREQAKESRD